MKHKIASMITALMMLSAVLLITGCSQAQGSKGTTNSSSSNAASKADLQGVWKVTSNGSYVMHICFEDTTIYGATNASGSFVEYPTPPIYKSDGTITFSGRIFTPVKNGENIDLQLGGVPAMSLTKDSSVSADDIKNALPSGTPPTPPSGTTASAEELKGVWKVTSNGSYVMHVYFDGLHIYAANVIYKANGTFLVNKLFLSPIYNSDGTITFMGKKYTPVKNGGAIALRLPNGIAIMSMAKDANVSADAIKNASPSQPNMASPEDLKGVWKVTSSGSYVTHIYFDGLHIYAASNATGSFVKYGPLTYRADGTIRYGEQMIVPIKNGEAINLLVAGPGAPPSSMSMTKDPSVSADAITSVQ